MIWFCTERYKYLLVFLDFMKVQSVIKVKLGSPEHSSILLDTMREFSKATQWASDYAFKHKVKSW